jgi:cysteine desulfurase
MSMNASNEADPLYLDANATEPLRPAARAALIDALDILGNPASIHAEGRTARRGLESARTIIAARFGARPQDVVFCSGATEANAMAIHAFGATRPIVIGATEHDAVRAAAPAAAIMPVDAAGLADLAWLEAELMARPGALVCVMAANNETGVLSPIAPIAALCAAHGALLHVDAVQAAGRILIDYLALGATSVAISAHKLGGPKGVGALILAPGVAATACSAASAGACIGSLIGQVEPWVAAGIPLVAGYTLFQRYPKVESHAMLIGETAIGVFAFEVLWSVMAPLLATHLG